MKQLITIPILALALTNIGCAEEVVRTDYQVYAPTVTKAIVYDGEEGELKYSHDSSITWFNNHFVAAWNANTNVYEGRKGQKNYWAYSKDGVNWTDPIIFEDVPDFGSPNWQTEWQPNLLPYTEDELWTVWTKSGGFVFSKMHNFEDAWEHRLVFPNIEYEGIKHFIFPSQNMTRLHDGSVIAPVVLREIPKPGQRDRPYGLAPLKTSDGGETWFLPEGSVARHPEYTKEDPKKVWESMYSIQKDGNIRMYARNEERDSPAFKALITAVGDENAENFAPSEFSPIKTIVSRMWLGDHDDHWMMLHHDTAATFFAFDRTNIALFMSRDGTDNYLPGVPLIDDEANVCYPQAMFKDGKMHIIYSVGAMPGSMPRQIKVATVHELPEADQSYLFPRATRRNITFSDMALIHPSYVVAEGDRVLEIAAEKGGATGYYGWFQFSKIEAGTFATLQGDGNNAVELALNATGELLIKDASGVFATGLQVSAGEWEFIGLAKSANGYEASVSGRTAAVADVSVPADFRSAKVMATTTEGSVWIGDQKLVGGGAQAAAVARVVFNQMAKAYGYDYLPDVGSADVAVLSHFKPEQGSELPAGHVGEVEFTGRSDVFKSTDAINEIGTGSVTVAGWVRVLQHGHGILFNGLSSDGLAGFSVSSSWREEVMVRIHDSRIEIRDFHFPQNNEWQFLALTLDNDSGEFKFWKDNQLVTSERTFGAGKDLSSGQPFGFGVGMDFAGKTKLMSPFYGSIHDLAVYEGKLSEAEIRAIRNRNAKLLDLEIAQGETAEPGTPLADFDFRKAASPERFTAQNRPRALQPTFETVDGTGVLRVRANGSAAVDMDGFDPAKDGVEVTFPVMMPEAPVSPTVTLLSMGGNHFVQLLLRGEDPDVLYVLDGDQVIRTDIPFIYGEWNPIKVQFSAAGLSLENGKATQSLPLQSLEQRLYIGAAYPEVYTAPVDDFMVNLNDFATRIVYTK